MLTITKTELIAIMGAAVAGSAPLDPAATYVGLIKALVNPVTPDMVVADLVEADYPGYARQAVGAWTTPAVESDGGVGVEGNMLEFRPSGPGTPNTIIGYFLTDLAAASGPPDTSAVLAAEIFDTPISLLDATNHLLISPEVSLDSAGDFGEAMVSD